MAPKFVSIQDQSIRLSNIKSFGISAADPKFDPLTADEIAAETAKKIEEEKKKKQLEEKLDEGGLLGVGMRLLNKYLESKKLPEPSHEPSRPARYYFYVTSFQGDNYRFYGFKTEVERYQKTVEDALASG